MTGCCEDAGELVPVPRHSLQKLHTKTVPTAPTSQVHLHEMNVSGICHGAGYNHESGMLCRSEARGYEKCLIW